VICAKTAEPIEMLWVLGPDGPKKSCVRLGPDPPMEKGNFEAGGWPILEGHSAVSQAKTGGPILTIYASMTRFLGMMLLVGVSLIMLPVYGLGHVPKKLNFGGVNRHFQAKLADCGWMAVCRLREKCFLRVTVLGSVDTTRDHGPCIDHL